ncbi:hypothetical protein ACP70R_034951 [Stipagrostis hirtigluma subsp. patula]
MATESRFDDLYTTTAAKHSYDGSSSSSQHQLTMYNYRISNPQFFPQPTNSPSTQLLSVVSSPGMYNVSCSLGQRELQIAAEVSPDYQIIRSSNVLHNISQMLMEDVDERASLHQGDLGEAAIQAAEKPFYDILAQVHQPPHNWPPPHSNNEVERHDECTSYKRLRRTSFSNNSYSILQPLPTPLNPYCYGRSLLLPQPPVRFGIPSLQLRGVVEGKGFDKLVIYLDCNKLSICRLATKANVGYKSKCAIFQVTDHRNNPYIPDQNNLEGRTGAITSCEIMRNEKLDRFLLCYGLDSFVETSNLRGMMAKEASINSLKGQIKESQQKKLRGKKQKQVKNNEVLDLRSLLIHCAQAVAAGDHLLATELIRNIRQHSSIDGDCTQRLAFYLVDALEARLAGIGSQVYQKITTKRITDEDMLKVYNLYLSACPFHRASYTFANKSIIEASKGQFKVHIVDFGISIGFQWPSLIQSFAKREGGPPMLRITGICEPRPGFRPLEMIEETGKRLADYANIFKVPFMFQGISSGFEAIQIEDLNIEEDEVLIINCMYRMKNLGDETIAMDSARDRVLKIMRRMNPNIFILGIVNASLSSPFFMTRFKEVLFHYSALFDMFDANVPRNNEARNMLEKVILGRDAFNIIAYEGEKRTERPETYKQWQVRCLQAGFQQLPVDPVILSLILEMKKGIYHEDFVADEESGWLLQGWKGRVIHALSKWKPNESYAGP